MWSTGSITSIGGSSYKCPDGSQPENEVKIISGVLGAPSSVTSIQVHNLLKLFKIPQVCDDHKMSLTHEDIRTLNPSCVKLLGFEN